MNIAILCNVMQRKFLFGYAAHHDAWRMEISIIVWTCCVIQWVVFVGANSHIEGERKGRREQETNTNPIVGFCLSR